jgi:hypothetical protein
MCFILPDRVMSLFATLADFGGDGVGENFCIPPNAKKDKYADMFMPLVKLTGSSLL